MENYNDSIFASFNCETAEDAIKILNDLTVKIAILRDPVISDECDNWDSIHGNLEGRMLSNTSSVSINFKCHTAMEAYILLARLGVLIRSDHNADDPVLRCYEVKLHQDDIFRKLFTDYNGGK